MRQPNRLVEAVSGSLRGPWQAGNAWCAAANHACHREGLRWNARCHSPRLPVLPRRPAHFAPRVIPPGNVEPDSSLSLVPAFCSIHCRTWNAAQIGFDPIREFVDFSSHFFAQWAQAVLDMRWNYLIGPPFDEAICLESLKRLREHSLADSPDVSAQDAESHRPLSQGNQDENTPAAGDVVQHAAGRTSRDHDIRFMHIQGFNG